MTTNGWYPITARACTNDHQIDICFNATPWFNNASDEQILELAHHRWGRDRAAYGLAAWTSNIDPELWDLFIYLTLAKQGGKQVTLDVTVSDIDALDWLFLNRQSLYQKISSLQEKGAT